MNCKEAEFVSALFDGETIPRTAAEHIGACEVCQRQMREYLEIGVELRRIASLETADEVPLLVLPGREASSTNWWQKGMETMRIPRFAFAALVAGVAVLASSLAVVGVRAHTDGTVLMLKVSTPAGPGRDCPVSTIDRKVTICQAIGVVNDGMMGYRIDLLSKDGNHVKLGVRSGWTPFALGTQHHAMSLAEIAALPQEVYAFEPGETLQFDVSGLGKMTVTGEWTDHLPSVFGAANHDLDPGPSELRFITPVLMQGKEMVADLTYITEISDRPDQGVMFYQPGLGSYELSLSPLKGAIEGSVKINRISFESDHKPYTFITGTPVARAEKVWILHDPDFKPAQGGESGYNAVESLRDQMVDPPAPN